jgi:pimeloyl-ACP methyl ester carboxylesterase
MLVIIRIFIAALLACMTCSPAAAAPLTVGVVLLHGLDGQPLGSGGSEGGGALVGGLRKAGYGVETPEMCWSNRRIYDRTFTDCFADIDAAIARLRAQGATQFVVGGMSMGGNSALAYAATHPDLLGVMAIAPAHDAATLAGSPRIAASLAQAQAAIAAGKGDAVQTYQDSNNSRRGGPAFTVRTSARNYASFVDPSGPANIAGDLPHLTVPVIWVAGTDDPTQALSAQEFAQIPANPLSKYVRVNSGHLGTPDAGASAMIDWVRALSAAKT